MNVASAFLLLLASATLAIAATLTKQDELVYAIHTSNHGKIKHKIVEALLQDADVDPSANDQELFLFAVNNDDFNVSRFYSKTLELIPE